jgi:hypothetical protein
MNCRSSGVIGFAVMVGLAGCKSKECTGIISCGGLSADSCGTVAGCSLGPGCVVTYWPGATECSGIQGESDCTTAECSWVDGTCVDSCSPITDMGVCSSTMSAKVDGQGNRLWFCSWENCLGTPAQRFCSEYSVSMCPVGLGCSVQDVSGFPDN